jgi:transposase
MSPLLETVSGAPRTPTAPTRFVGLDVHKHYLVAVAVDAQKEVLLGPQRVEFSAFDAWCAKTLCSHDAVVLEMTTNTWQLYDELVPHVQSVTVVHPPHVALITRAQVMTDRIAALVLARLHAAGLLPAVWVPEPAVRDRRALIAARAKQVRLQTQAKNRLHAVLHRHHLPPAEGDLFTQDRQAWWQALPVTPLERVQIQANLATLTFAQEQIARFDQCLTAEAAADERVPWLIQLPGFALTTALTVLAAIGDIRRFPDAAHLVGYAGLGARVHASGLTYHTGRITKAGRRDLRWALIEVAQSAALHHPHWQAVLARLEARLGRNKAIVAIARKLLVIVWHVLTARCADRCADPEQVARKFLHYSYRLGRAHRPAGQSAGAYVRTQLDRLGLGADLEAIVESGRTITMPPSRLTPPQAETQTPTGETA